VPAGLTWADVDPSILWNASGHRATVLSVLRAEFSSLIELEGDTGLPYTDPTFWLEGWTESYTASRWFMTLAVSDFAQTAVTT
jgi:hypothetical protein